MNCFSHAYPFLDRDPYFVVGTCVPDWLSMVARKTRAREKNAVLYMSDQQSEVAELAAGIVQHHRDDHWFHDCREFVELNLQFSIELRELLGSDAGFRPHLAGHILIEVLLDGYLQEKTDNGKAKLDQYYAMVQQVDPKIVEQVINRIAAKPTDKINWFLPKFINEAYLYDYVDDDRVHYRLNRVLKSVKLAELPDEFLDWLPHARKRVYDQAAVMLTPPDGKADNGKPN